MILVAVDDFLFRSKIRTTGKQAGVELSFPKTPDELIEQARALKPALAIFDLNSSKMDPIGTIARMKQDGDLKTIPTLGFVSHVDTSSIQAARVRRRRRDSRPLGLCCKSRRYSHRARSDEVLTLDDIRAAARRIDGRVLRTPLRPSSWLSAATDAEVRLKLEVMQPTSSYKVRGALNTVLRIAEEHGANPPFIVTASAGNHGRAMAWATRGSNIALTVYVPEKAPRTKLEAIAASGATVVRCRDYDDAERRAKEEASREQARYVSPYSHPDVIAGAGTVGLEIIDEWPDVDLIVVPVGGGGLISGIALAATGISKRVRVAGVEVEASCPFTRGMAAGRIVEIDVQPTLADGLSGNLDPDTLTFEIVRRLVPEIALVSEPQVRGAIADLMKYEDLTTEGAGAVGVAALTGRKARYTRQASSGRSVRRKYRCRSCSARSSRATRSGGDLPSRCRATFSLAWSEPARAPAARLAARARRASRRQRRAADPNQWRRSTKNVAANPEQEPRSHAPPPMRARTDPAATGRESAPESRR